MRAFAVVAGIIALQGLLAPPAAGDLAEPAVNHGATTVRIDGTRVTAEAWALALGHDVDAIVVTRLKTRDGKPAKVETYERWSRDGRAKSERGSRALGRAWEKHLWALLDAGGKDKQARKRKRKDLLDRALGSLGPQGERTIDGYVVAWTLLQGMTEKGGKRSRARIAIFTYTPSGTAVTPPPGGPRPGTVTPHEKAPHTKAPHEKAMPKGVAPSGKARPRGATPLTPRAGPDRRPPFPAPRGGAAGPSFGSASGSGEARADSEKGVREHARVSVDLGRFLPPPAKKPKAPSGPVTPKSK